MFIDKAKIYIKSGDGGSGIVSFLRLKTIPKGGPDGGDGGDGGSIVFVADASKNNLSDFYYQVHYRAENGDRGQPKNCTGKRGKDTMIRVPAGTVIRDAQTDAIIADMFHDGQTLKVLEGGRGGKGNTKFSSSRRRAPSFSQAGEKTKEIAVILELKTIADVGLIGFPNVGKSTLLSVVSAARPKIADYHFTTLSPNLGVVRYYEHSFVMADIPGLIEGAGSGAGLGHDFLRHVERTRMLVHVVDMAGTEGRDPVEDYRKINAELKIYSKKLLTLPQIIAANKMDMPGAEENLKRFKRSVRKYPVVPVTAAIGENTSELIAKVWSVLSELAPVQPLEFEPHTYERPDGREFEIELSEDGVFVVTGGLVDRLSRGVILDNPDSFRYFQRQLRLCKVIDRLKKMGIKDGDHVVFGNVDFDYVE